MATYQIPLPVPMYCNEDVATNWRVFQDAYEDFALAAQLSDKLAEVQAATLQMIIFKECKQILNRLGLTNKELKRVLQYFTNYRSILWLSAIFCLRGIIPQCRATAKWLSGTVYNPFKAISRIMYIYSASWWNDPKPPCARHSRPQSMSYVGSSADNIVTSEKP